MGVLILLLFLFSGVLCAFGLFRAYAVSIRLWIGGVMGFCMAMWFPTLFAFFLRFTRGANLCAVALALLLGGAVFLALRKRKAPPSLDWRPSIRQMLLCVVPLLLIFAYLQHTHYLRQVEGALHVGQSTYGDICMHAAIATSLQDAAFPPAYSILPDARLGYPFLVDALSTTMLLFGSSLRVALIVPGVLLGFLTFAGFFFLAERCTRSSRVAVVAFLLFFLNGGLGFLYAFDLVGEDASAVTSIFTGYYLAPANMPAYNLRWVNILCDMLLPQRTFLAGMAVLLPCLWLLLEGVEHREKTSPGRWCLLGVLAGALPMIHTHSFLALGLMSLGVIVLAVCRRQSLRSLRGFLLYGMVAVSLALPQLLVWTFPQTGTAGALAFVPGWVNNTGVSVRDETLWFWVKNMGPVFLLLVPAALSAEGSGRSLCVGAGLCFCVANLFRFQMLLYDNNKLMYAAYALLCPYTAAYLVRIYDRLQGIPGRRFLAGCFLFVSLFSGALSIGREVVSDYQLFSADEVCAAEYLREETPAGITVLTGRQHNNLASVLSGKNVVCGPDNFLATHGLPYDERAAVVPVMFTHPAENLSLFAQYGVEYVLIGPSERGQFAVDEAWFLDNCTLVYRNDSVSLYRFG